MFKNIILFSFFLISSISLAQPASEQMDHVVRVKFTSPPNLESSVNERIRGNSYLATGFSTVDNLNTNFDANKLRRVFPYAGKFEAKHVRFGLHLWYDIYVDSNASVETLVTAYGDLSEISVAEPVSRFSIEGKAEMVNANDPRIGEQWHYNNTGQTGGTVGADISLFEAWQEEAGDARVVVSVHDSGIDYNHPDLDGVLWTNRGEIPNDGLDNDNNGYIDDYYGYNFAAAVVGGDPTDVYDFGGHGTHTSGTIAAENNNATGVAGVAGGNSSGNGVKIMMMRLGDDNGSPYIYNPAPSFIYAADMGAIISSNSWGGGGYNQSIYDAIEYFTEEAGGIDLGLEGGLVLMSSGNSSSASIDYRSYIDGVLMVSATNHNDQLSWYSNYGSWVDICAPGGETSVTSQGVLSTLPYNSYGFYQGTSMACPHLAGVAALVASKAFGTQLTSQQLEIILLETADPIDDINSGYNGLLGSGRVNAERALQAVSSVPSSGSTLSIDPISIDARIRTGQEEAYTVNLFNNSDHDIQITLDYEELNWLGIETRNLDIASQSVGKFKLNLLAPEAGFTANTEIKFSYISIDGKVEQSLPIALYTLGDPALNMVDSIIFETTYPGEVNRLAFEMTNVGYDELALSNFRTISEFFTISLEDVILAPNESVFGSIEFSPLAGIQYLDSLQFDTNIPSMESMKVILVGQGNPSAPANITVDPASIEFEVVDNRYGTQYFTISNTGEELLTGTLSLNPYTYLSNTEVGSTSFGESSQQDTTPETEDLGDLVGHIESPVNNEGGLAWDGEYLWISDSDNAEIYQFDVNTQTIIDTIQSVASNGVALAFDGEFLWQHDYREKLIKYNLEGEVLHEIALNDNLSYERGIAADNGGIWMADYNNFYSLDKGTGTELESFYNYYATYANSMVSVGNRLFICGNGRVYDITKGSSSRNSYTSYIAGRSYASTSDMTFDGQNAWVSFMDEGELVSFELFSDFTYYLSNSYLSLEPNESRTYSVYYNLSGYEPGITYSDYIKIESNSNENSELVIPITAYVRGQPILDVDPGNLSFEAYIGFESIETLVIANTGTENLDISEITTSNDAFVFDFSPASIPPNQTVEIAVSISITEEVEASGIMTILSNDISTPSKEINLYAIGKLAPEIELDQTTFDLSVYQSQIDSLPLLITNSGNGGLNYSIQHRFSDSNDNVNVVSSSESFKGTALLSKDQEVNLATIPTYESKRIATTSVTTEPGSLESKLTLFTNGYPAITDLIPNKYSFRDGIYGYSISDGGGDMYDGGNYLSTDLGSYINYSNNVIATSSNLGSDYFTTKEDGLFVFAGNTEAITEFKITGNLGADGSGSVDGVVLSLYIDGREYLGFVKRVYNAYDPSINHLIIVPNNGSVTHEFYTNTDYDDHYINNLGGTNRLYYLLFASSNGGYVDNEAMSEIMRTFLEVIEEGPELPDLEPNSSTTEYVKFNTENLLPNNYEYNVEVASNDPSQRSILIPTTLQVNSRPIISSDAETVSFDEVFVGTTEIQYLGIQNSGSDTLFVSSVDLGNSGSFQAEITNDTILPNTSQFIQIQFSPTVVANYTRNMFIRSNDPLQKKMNIVLTGTGAESVIIQVPETSLNESLIIGDLIQRSFAIENIGSLPLDYGLYVGSSSSGFPSTPGTQVDWLSCANYEYRDQEALTSQDISMYINTENLDEGNYSAVIRIVSNDSQSTDSEFVVNLSVKGIPNVEIPQSLIFEEVSFGQSQEQSLEIINRGTGSTYFTSSIDSLSDFSVNSNDTTYIEPYSQYQLEVGFESNSLGYHSDTLFIHHGETSQTDTVYLSANLVAPGEIQTSAEYFQLEANYQGSVDSLFTIYNIGKGDLHFNLSWPNANTQVSSVQGNNMASAPTPTKGEKDTRTGTASTQTIDSFGYSIYTSQDENGPEYFWDDISSNGEELSLSDDDYSSVSLPFEFSLYGIRKTELFISSNGLLAFSGLGTNNPINAQIPSFNAPNGIIAPFWKDLSPNLGGTIHHSVADDRVIIQYSDVPDYDQTGTYTFQVILYTSGDIVIFYKDMNGVVSDATIGIESEQGDTGYEVAFNQPFVTDEMALKIEHPMLRFDAPVTFGTIAPGDSLDIRFTYNSLDDLGGFQQNNLSIISNDTITPTKEILFDVMVDAPSKLALSRDSIDFEDTYINRVSEQQFWIENDSVGILRVTDIISSKESFSVVFPSYNDSYYDSIADYSVGVYYNSNSGRLQYALQSSLEEVFAIKLYTKVDDERSLISDLSFEFYVGEERSYEGSTVVTLNENQLWALAQGNIYLDFYTRDSPDGYHELQLKANEISLNPFNTSSAINVLFKSTTEGDHSGALSFESNSLVVAPELFITGTTLESSVTISLDQTSISEKLAVNDSSEQVFVITNEGTDSLKFNISMASLDFKSNLDPSVFSMNEVEAQSRSQEENPYQVIFPSEQLARREGESSAISMTVGSGLFYGLYNFNGRSIVSGEINNPNSINVEHSFVDFSMASEFLLGSETELLMMSYTGYLYVTNMETKENTYLGYFPTSTYWMGMTTDPRNGRIYLTTEEELYSLDLNDLSISYLGNYEVGRVAGIAMNTRGEMYGYSFDQEFFKVDVSNGQTEIVGIIDFIPSYGQDMAYDVATNTFYMASYESSGLQSKLRSVDVLTGLTSVIGVIGDDGDYSQMGSLAFPLEQTNASVQLEYAYNELAPSESMKVTTKFNSTGLYDGVYSTSIRIKSNDLSNPNVEIPVTLEVEGNEPMVVVTKDTLQFGYVTIGDTRSDFFEIQNNGADVLAIKLMSTNAFIYSPYQLGDSLRIDIGETLYVPISFVPENYEILDFVMSWETNDPEHPIINIQMNGAVQRAPGSLSISEESLAFGLFQRSEDSLSYSISSVGIEPVEFSLWSDSTVNWIDLPDTVIVLAPSETYDFNITVNSESLLPGDYTTAMTLLSNDPRYDSLEIPITLSVLNQIPYEVGEFESINIAIEENQLPLIYDLEEYFNDDDNDTMSYEVSSQNDHVTTAIEGNVMSLTGKSYGADTLTIICTDVHGAQAQSSFALFSNTIPIASQELPELFIRLSMTSNEDRELLDLNNYFSDSDNDQLSYSLSFITSGIAEVSINAQNTIVGKGLSTGSEILTLTVSDGYHSTTHEIVLTIAGSRAMSLDFDASIVSLFQNEEVTKSLVVEGIGEDSVFVSLSSDVTLDWITLPDTSMWIQSGEEMRFDIVYNTNELVPDTYSTAIQLETNDSDFTQTSIPIELEVINQVPVQNELMTGGLLAIGKEDSFFEYNLSDYFSDLDTDELMFEVMSTEGHVSFELTDQILLVEGQSYGYDSLEVEVRDIHGGMTSTLIPFFSNHEPTLTKEMEDFYLRLTESFSSYLDWMDLDDHFTDQDGDVLTFSVSEPTNGNVELALNSSNVLAIKSISAGAEIVTISINDGYHIITHEVGIVIDATRAMSLDFDASIVSLFQNEEVTKSLVVEGIGEDSVFVSLSSDVTLDWITLPDTSMWIQSGEEMRFDIAYNTNELVPDTYSTAIQLETNDSDFTQTSIPIELEVINQVPVQNALMTGGLLAIGKEDSFFEYNLSDYFSDLDADEMSFDIVSSDGKVIFDLTDQLLVVQGQSYGSDTLRIEVSDIHGSIISTSVPFFSNHVPIMTDEIEDFYIRYTDEVNPYLDWVDLDEFFMDQDDEVLKFSISEPINGTVELALNSNNMIVVKPLKVGVETFTLSVTDGYHVTEHTISLTIDAILSIDGSVKSSWKFYPNPVQRELKIETGDTNEVLTFEIIDLAGNVLRKETIPAHLRNKVERIDMESFKTGIYLFSIKVGNQSPSVQRISVE